MTEPIVVQEPVAAPVEHVYRYQPRDENGQPLGGEQVVKFDGTPEDLGNKMAENNSRLVALNRKLNKQVRLSASFKEEIPDNAPRFDPSKYDLKPMPLTAEERIQLVQDIQDPEKFPTVSRRLVQAEIGDPDILRTRISRIEQRLDRTNVHEEAVAFRRDRPDYFPTRENLETLAAWIERNDLDPIRENFCLAYDTLKDYLDARPAAAAVVPVVAPVVAVQDPPPVVDNRPGSSGLTRTVASDSGPASKSGYSQKEIDAMSAEEYRVKVLLPEFHAKQKAR